MSNDYEARRARMVREQIEARGLRDSRVCDALRRVPRHRFVPEHLWSLAYEDGPLPIGQLQTISQPYIVALMTHMLELKPHDIVLEIGTGSGYQTAVLCELAQMVYSVERHAALGNRARALLRDLGYDNMEVYIGDGSQGLPDMAPFDAIIVTASAPAIPGPLRTQMADGARMVIPIGDRQQQFLQRIRRIKETWRIESLIPVMFVPLIGRHGHAPSEESSSDSE